MKIILIGKICSGKDTVASLLPGIHLAFGDKLKEIAGLLRAIGPMRTAQIMQEFTDISSPSLILALTKFSQIPYTPPKDRELLQELGTYCHLQDEEIWIRPVRSAVTSDCVITDCRRYTELLAFPEFTRIYIEAPEKTRKLRMLSRDNSCHMTAFEHPAEEEIEGLQLYCDKVIQNDGSIEKLKKSVNDILRSLASLKE